MERVFRSRALLGLLDRAAELKRDEVRLLWRRIGGFTSPQRGEVNRTRGEPIQPKLIPLQRGSLLAFLFECQTAAGHRSAFPRHDIARAMHLS